MNNIHLIMLLILFSSLFLLHCSVIGLVVNHFIKIWQYPIEVKSNNYLRWFFAMNSGLLFNITILFVLGIMGFLYKSVVLWSGVINFILATLILFRIDYYRSFKNISPVRLKTVLEFLTLTLLFLFLIMKAVKVPGHWDDTSYHLPMARFYIENHAIILNQYLRFPLFPQNINLLLALGLMLGQEIFAQGLATLPLFMTCIGLIGASIRMLNSTFAGYLAIMMLLLLHPAKYIIGYAYIDHGLALFCWGAVLALAMWNITGRQTYGWVILSGLLAGGAAGSKYFGAVLAILIGLYLLLVCRAWRAAVLYAITVTLLGSGWYLRSLLISGDPIHPAGGAILGHFLWDAQDLVNQQREQATFGVGKNLFYLIPGMIKARVSPWVFALFSACFFRKKTTILHFFYTIFLSYLLFWFYVSQVPRYLAPLFALGCFLTVYTIYQCARKWLTRTIFAKWSWLHNPSTPSAIFLLFLLPFFLISCRKSVKMLGNWEKYLEQNSGYTLFQQANQLIPFFGSRLVQLGFEKNIYFFKGITIGDCFGIGRYRNVLELQSPHQLIHPQEMIRYLNQFNSRMLIVGTKQFTMDLAAYTDYFDIQKETTDGLLLTIKLKG